MTKRSAFKKGGLQRKNIIKGKIQSWQENDILLGLTKTHWGSPSKTL